MIAGDRARPEERSSLIHAGSLSPADKVVVGYLTVVAALTLLSAARVRHWWLVLAAHAAASALIVLAARWSGHVPVSSYRRVLLMRSWYPLVLIPFTYKELTYLIPLIHPRDLDWELAAIDYWMFGVHPTVWLERYTSPLATELFQLAYMAYYFMPLVLGLVLWWQRRLEEYHFLLFVVVLGFYLSYIGYIAVPAIGPRFILSDQQTEPLSGVLLFEWLRVTLDRMEGITRDCFPSGHTELTILILFYSYRFHRPTFWWVLPAGSALIVSTVYLRYHYVIDVIAGVALAAVVIAIARPTCRAFGGRSAGEPSQRD